MGVCDYGEHDVNQFRSEQWQSRNFESCRTSEVPQEFWQFEPENLGLSRYASVKEVDRFSNYSTDDTCSTTDSTSDSASIISSQSCYTSGGTDATDFTSDDDFSEVKHVFQTSKTLQEVQSRIEEQGWLSGLEAKPLTKQNIDCMQQLALEKERQRQTLQGLPEAGTTRLSQDAVATSCARQPPPIGGKCNRRRSGSHTSTAGPPCKLKRDTESTDCFVTLLIIFATRLITAMWPLSASPPMMTSCFNGAGVLPLRVFIQETLRRSKTSYSTLQVALYYLILLKGKLGDSDFTKEQPSPSSPLDSGERSTCRAMQCGRRMFLAALMLASKYLQDRNYSTRAWSKISGLRSAEINENETEYLKSIDYNLHITKESFENWSKIVLTLSKLSKLEPGCHYRKQRSLDSYGSGMDSILAQMMPGADEPDFLEDQIYSDQWWTNLIKQLQPDIVEASEVTESFLQDNVPMDDVSELLAKLDHTLPAGPGSPESYQPYVADITFNEALLARSTHPKAVASVTSTLAASPARCTALPLRPQPRNLPTPQSTPRAPEACPWVSRPMAPNSMLRCSASSEALGSLRKQCFRNANLERCPPPRGPTSVGLPSMRTLLRSAESKQECASSLVIPLISSPTSSVTSESTTRTGRSRSSSISSNSSWSSWASGPPRSLQPINDTSQFCSSLSKVSSVPAEGVVVQTGRLRDLARQLGTSTVAVFSDEGYGSGEERKAKLNNGQLGSSNEVDAIHALIAMSSSNDRPTPSHPIREELRSRLQQQQQQRTENSPSRGHKRTISRTSDTNTDRDRTMHIVRYHNVTDEVVEDFLLSTHEIQAAKQWQTPSKKWAAGKKPIPNSLDSKRLAMACAAQQRSAPNLASQYLKDEYLGDQMLTA